jgi:hypothetical protein
MPWSLVTPALGGTTEESWPNFAFGLVESGVGGKLSVTGKWPWIPLCAKDGMVGQSRWALPVISNVDLLGDGDRIINIDAKVPDGAFDFAMAEKKLNVAEISSSPIDQGRFGASQRMSAESRGVEADAGNPF